MTIDIACAAWPLDRMAEALQMMAPARNGNDPSLTPSDLERLAGPIPIAHDALSTFATRLGLQVEPVDATYAALPALLRDGAPFAIRSHGGATPSYLLVTARIGGCLEFARPDGARVRFPISRVTEMLRAPIESPQLAAVEGLLEEAGVPRKRRGAARRRLLAERLAGKVCGTMWRVSTASGPSLRRRLLDDNAVAYMVAFLLTTVGAQAAWIGPWWVLGRAAFRGWFDSGSMAAWVLLLASHVLLRMGAHWAQSVAAVRLGAAVRQRLLSGALHLDADSTRHRGVGQWFGVVLEAGWIESTALETAFASVVGLVEIASAVVLLAAGAGGLPHAWLLVAWVGALALGVRQIVVHCAAWTNGRLRMTYELVEKLLGHRTRIAQDAPENWHREDDAALDLHLERSQNLDRWTALLEAFSSRGWLVLGCVALIPTVETAGVSGERWAPTIAGMVVAYLSLRRTMSAISTTAIIGVAWTHIAPLMNAGREAATALETKLGLEESPKEYGDRSQVKRLEGRGLSFAYREEGAPVLDQCSIRVERGDRLLLTGPSGAGKSTLLGLLSGLRTPQDGRVTARGIDLELLDGPSLRRAVATAPQFHDNYVLAETFAFNLLFGRRWPPSSADLVEAREVCADLGLGPLLDRMPGGLFQQIGETGWQLSHGERSRLFVARALLQRASVVLLDESFGALDPESLRQCLECVERRSETTVLVAHW